MKIINYWGYCSAGIVHMYMGTNWCYRYVNGQWVDYGVIRPFTAYHISHPKRTHFHSPRKRK